MPNKIELELLTVGMRPFVLVELAGVDDAGDLDIRARYGGGLTADEAAELLDVAHEPIVKTWGSADES